MVHRMKTTIVSVKRSRKTIQELCQVLALVALFSCLVLVGCSKRYHDLPSFSPIPIEDYDNHSVGRFKTTYLAEQIDNYYRGTNPGPIGVTTFVNIDDLNNTSTFGRMYGEQLMSELAMRGYDVVELRHADALQFLNNTGEFALSRDMGLVKKSQNLGGVVVGTYVVSPLRVYVNARLVDPSSSIILSAGSVEMSKTDELARLLRGGSFPGTLERIPVRHLGMTAYPASMFPGPSMRVYNMEEESSSAAPVRELLPEIGPKIK
jgi:TolB-like protein